MSYDLRIGVKVEGLGKIVCIGSPDLDEPTYNLGKMFRECTDWDFEQGEWYNCKEVLPKIRYGMMMLATATNYYRQYEPENGWGTVETAKATLHSLHDCITDWAEIIPLEHLWVRW